MFSNLYCRIHLLTTNSVSMVLTFRASYGRIQSAAVQATLPRTQWAPWLVLSTSNPRSAGHPASQSVGTVASSLYVQPPFCRPPCLAIGGHRGQFSPRPTPVLQATLPRNLWAPWLVLSTSNPVLQATLPRNVGTVASSLHVQSPFCRPPCLTIGGHRG